MAVTPIWKGSTDLEEQPNSPEYTNGERIVCVRNFKGPYATALAAAPVRGSQGTGDQTGWLVDESRVVREKGGVGSLTIRYVPDAASLLPSWPGASSTTLPLDECSVSHEKLETALEKHVNYSSLTEAQRDAVRLLLQNYDQYKADYEATVTGHALTNQLWLKLKRGMTHYVTYYPVYRWTLYSWQPPVGEAGGYIQTPYGPISVPGSVVWLRQGDQIKHNGSHWVLERSWLGGDAASIDADIYPTG
jgi:hypothetical protein